MDKDTARTGLEMSAKWFEYHAGQRQDMFKTFLIITAGLCSIIGYLLQAKLLPLLALSGLSLSTLAALFWKIDDRSRHLVGIGETAYQSFWSALGLPNEFCPPLQSAKKQPRMLRFKTLYRAAYLVCFITGVATTIVGVVLLTKA
ncbi:hypothetical protein [Rhizobium chutanense]|uniref:Uncharacterized protein n=1 Tax=Rhizobium chutanense TaxID=2035448 RepID=A0A3S0XDD3_9HYPH|nr:hypothetical protein [Rhizobium chutanense]RUL97747.1 hypothetical protein EFR84_30060 [Rhizobium chutanense]